MERLTKREGLVTVTFRAVRGQLRVLEQLSQSTGKTKSDLIREALTFYLNRFYEPKEG